MQDQEFVTILEIDHIKIVHECKNWIPFHRLQALLYLQRRVNTLATDLKRKGFFSIKMFERSLDKADTYLNCLDVHKTKWIGFRFHFAIIWSFLVDGEDNEF